MQNFKKCKFGVMADDLLQYLNRLNYQEKTIQGYRYRLIHLQKMLQDGDETIVDYELWQNLVIKIDENKEWQVIDTYRKSLLFTINAMFQYHVTGSIETHNKKSLDALLEEKKCIPELKSYVKNLQELKYQEHTINEHITHILKLQEFLFYNNIALNNLTSNEIIEFINSLIGYSEQTRYRILCCLRVFLKYLYNNEIINQNLHVFIPSVRLKNNNAISSIHNKEEVNNLISSINTESPVGKRDYAIILLIIKLGLRSSDVAHLEFSNIHWDINEIQIIQYKTLIFLNLPLLSDVGNAIIDYIQHSRPNSDLPNVFLQARPKFQALNSSSITSIFEKQRIKSGIYKEPGRKYGPHSYRHSLVNELMNKEIPYPIITQILGHANSNSTMFYTSINLTQLKKCVLEVPPLDTNWCLKIKKGDTE